MEVCISRPPYHRIGPMAMRRWEAEAEAKQYRWAYDQNGKLARAARVLGWR